MINSSSEDARVKIPLLAYSTRTHKYIPKVEHSQLDSVTKIHPVILQAALTKLNNSISVTDVVDKLTELISNTQDKGRSFHKHILDPVNNLIDYGNPLNNLFHVTTELPYPKKGSGSFRPDIVIYVNGIPLAFIEVKPPNNKNGLYAEYDRMKERLSNSSYLTFFNQMLLMGFTNNQPYLESGKQQGSYYTTCNGQNLIYNHWREEQKFPIPSVNDHEISLILEDNNFQWLLNDSDWQQRLSSDNPANQFFSSLFSPERFLSMIQHGFAYLETQSGIEKHVMRYPQFFASEAILQEIDGKQDSEQLEGTIWHTQGSGKTALAYYAAQKIRHYYMQRNMPVKFFFIPDRTDLVHQAATEFQIRGMSTLTIESRQQFVEALKTKSVTHSTVNAENGTINILNIHKFSESSHLKPENNSIQRIYFIDECHRSYAQNGTNLSYLKGADPNGIYIGLTGTPLIGDKTTKSMFGDYIHTYSTKQSVQDGYTLKMKRDDIHSEFSNQLKTQLEISDNITPAQWTEINKRKDFNSKISEYIHNDLNQFRGIINKPELGAMIVASSTDQAKLLHGNLTNLGMKTALIISEEGNTKHLQKEFKGHKQPDGTTISEIDAVIVYDMLSTGFDAPRLKRLYMLRSRNEHNLLQTLARVNRPYRDMKYGHIVDFVGITENYQETRAKYAEELGNNEQIEDYFIENQVLKGTLENIFKWFINEGYNLDSVEKFTQQIELLNESDLKTIITKLETIVETSNQLYISYEHEYVEALNINSIKKKLSETKNRLDLMKGSQALTTGNSLPDDIPINDIVNFQYRGTEELSSADQQDLEILLNEIQDLQKSVYTQTVLKEERGRKDNERSTDHIDRLETYKKRLQQEYARNLRIGEMYSNKPSNQEKWFLLHVQHQQILQSDNTTTVTIVKTIMKQRKEVIGHREEKDKAVIKADMTRPIKTILEEYGYGIHWQQIVNIWV